MIPGFHQQQCVKLRRNIRRRQVLAVKRAEHAVFTIKRAMHPLHQPAVIMCAHLHQEINADPELRHLRRTAAAVHILDKRPDAGPLLNQVLRTEFFLDPAHGRTADRIFLAKLVLRRQQHAGQKFPLQNLRSQVFIKFLRRCHFLSYMLPVMFHVIYYKQKTRSVNPSFRKKRKKSPNRIAAEPSGLLRQELKNRRKAGKAKSRRQAFRPLLR